MREVLDDIERWRGAGKQVAVARVVGVDGSGPRDPGATMAVSQDGEVAGWIAEHKTHRVRDDQTDKTDRACRRHGNGGEQRRQRED